MDFAYSDKVKALQEKLGRFMDDHVYPNEHRYHEGLSDANRWQPRPVVEELKPKAQGGGLVEPVPAGIANSAPASPTSNTRRSARSWAASHWAPEVFNCSAPDTGNMEVLVRYGTAEQKKQWLEPLLEGEIRSAFAMTEPAVASSDATNIEASIKRDGDHYVINGRKWWTSGAPDPRCKILIFMGKTRPGNPDKHQQQSMILVPHGHARRDADAPAAGLRLRRRAARPCRGRFRECARAREQHAARRGARLRDRAGAPRARAASITACASSAWPSARSRSMCKRVKSRVAFGKPLAEQTVTLERIAESRIMIEQARLLTLKAAYMMDTVGNKAARAEIAMIKVAAPNMALPGHRLGDPGAWRRRRVATISVSPRPMPARAPCASPTAPTKSIATRSAASSCRSTTERVGRPARPVLAQLDRRHGEGARRCGGEFEIAQDRAP